MRISDWSSDVCSSDLKGLGAGGGIACGILVGHDLVLQLLAARADLVDPGRVAHAVRRPGEQHEMKRLGSRIDRDRCFPDLFLRQSQRRAITKRRARSEEHTSELQSLMRISYAVFCLKKKKKK